MLVSNTQVNTCKKLEETVHVQCHVRLLSQDSTFDLFNFFPNFFSQNLSCQTWGAGAAYLRVRLIHWCVRYLTQRAEILSRRSNLMPQQANKEATNNTVNDLSGVCGTEMVTFRQNKAS